MVEYAYRDLTRQIIGAAIEVHRQLGPGLLVRAVIADPRSTGSHIPEAMQVASRIAHELQFNRLAPRYSPIRPLTNSGPNLFSSVVSVVQQALLKP
jgi:hypothetical protein